MGITGVRVMGTVVPDFINPLISLIMYPLLNTPGEPKASNKQVRAAKVPCSTDLGLDEPLATTQKNEANTPCSEDGHTWLFSTQNSQ